MAATELSLESYHIEQVGDSISAKQLRRNAVMHHGKENPEEPGTSTTTPLQCVNSTRSHEQKYYSYATQLITNL